MRDLGDRRWAALEWRNRAVGNGALPHPTIVAFGPPITSPGGHCWHMGRQSQGKSSCGRRCRNGPSGGWTWSRSWPAAATPPRAPTSWPASSPSRSCAWWSRRRTAMAWRSPPTPTAYPPSSRRSKRAWTALSTPAASPPTGIRLPDQLLERLVAHQTAVCPHPRLGARRPRQHPPAVLARMAQAGHHPGDDAGRGGPRTVPASAWWRAATPGSPRSSHTACSRDCHDTG